MREVVQSRTGMVVIAAAALSALAVATGWGVRVVLPLALVAVTLVWLKGRAHALTTSRRAAADRAAKERQVLAAATSMDLKVDGLARRIEEAWDRTSFIRTLIDEDRARIDKLGSDVVARTWSNTRLISEGLRLLRSEVSELSEMAQAAESLGDDIPAVTAAPPALSIAIPGYNRPSLLAECLESIVAEVERSGTDRIEVWVTDDCSPRRSAVETGRDFASRYPYIGFRRNSENLGLERNLIEACQPCRGQFLLIVGNDDKVYPGAFDEILADIDDDRHDLVVYGKVRVDPTGAAIDNPARGAIPDDSALGDRREYGDVLGFARSTGILSGYGFISAVMMRRDMFLAVDASPYLGLAMYPQVGRLLDAFERSPTMFRNVPVVYHRTTTRSEKFAEAVGRPEESFMVGGTDRDMRWFGPTLAALLMRVCDSTSIEPADLLDIPEHLFGQDNLVDWILANTNLAAEREIEIDPAVRVDANRFLESVEPHRRGAAPAESEGATAGDGGEAPSGGSAPESDSRPVASPQFVSVTRVELETVVSRVEALEEALDALVAD